MPSDPRADGPLHLVPLGNLASLLVPVAVVTANLAVTALWPVTPTPEAEAEAEPPPSLGLSVLVEPDGYVITTGTGSTQVLSCGGCGDPHDPRRLQATLRELKQAHPDEHTVVVVPDQATSYEVLMRTVRATRADDEGSLFPQAIIAGLGE